MTITISDETANPLQEGWDHKIIAGKAVRGALALFLRQAGVHGANAIGAVFLARLLSPADFGLYAIVFFVLAFSVTFGGTGLAANLIRQHSEPSDLEYRSVFAVQQVFVWTIAVVIWLLSPWINTVYHLPGPDVWVFRFVALSFLLTSFMVVPQVQMERGLAFDKLAIIEAVQAFIFNVVAVLFAWKGYAGFSFALALALRSLAGVVLAYKFNPWSISWAWDWHAARTHLAFGFYYQAGQIVNLAKDMISPVFVGIVIGTAAVGYINWTCSFANYPVIVLMMLNRLYLPAFSRLAHVPVQMRRAVEIVVSLLGGFVFTLSAVMYVFRHQLIVAIFGEKWLTAMPLFLPMILINILLMPALVGINALNALGQSKFVLKVMALWTVSTWVLGPVFITLYGWQAWGWINLAVHTSTVLVLIRLHKTLGIDWLRALSRPLLVAAGCLASAQLALLAGAHWIPSLICSAAVGVGGVFLFLKGELLQMRRALSFAN